MTKEKTRVGLILQGLGKVGKPFLEILSKTPIPGAEILGKLSDMIKDTDQLRQEEKEQILSAIQLDLKDLADSREFNLGIQQSQFSSWGAKNIAVAIDILVTVTWILLTYIIVFRLLTAILNGNDIPDLTVIMAIYTTVSVKFEQILAFHRGSSMGSKIKDFIKM